MTATSLIQFSDYLMPIGTTLKSQQLESTIEDQPLLGLHGTYAPSGYATGAVISLTIEMGGGGDVSPTTSGYMITLDDVNNEANLLFQRLNSGYQKLIIGTTPARYIMAQKRKFTVTPMEGSGRTHYNVELEFYAQDPRWLSNTLHTQSFAANTTAGITNAGSARSYPVFTITGGTTNPLQVKAGAAGNPAISPGIQVALNTTISTGDQIVIDCDPRNRANAITLFPAGGGASSVHFEWLGTSGISNALGTADMFPFLDPGITQVCFGNGNNTSGSIAWRDAWGL